MDHKSNMTPTKQIKALINTLRIGNSLRTFSYYFSHLQYVTIGNHETILIQHRMINLK